MVNKKRYRNSSRLLTCLAALEIASVAEPVLESSTDLVMY